MDETHGAAHGGDANDEGPGHPGRQAARGARRAGKTALNAVAALCLAVTLTHGVMVFLHVAPPNVVSQRYSRQVNAWIYPLFEQNWRMFAPDPDSVNRKIFARTAHTAPDGSVQVGPWTDLSAVDEAAIDHNPFPSHASQNLLRRAWTAYAELHGGDDISRSDRALMLRQYLRNIAAARMAELNDKPFEDIQLRVVTLPVPAPGTADSDRRAASAKPMTRLLPWWKVGSDASDGK